jgi:membrane-associated phospholipid phosphatase
LAGFDPSTIGRFSPVHRGFLTLLVLKDWHRFNVAILAIAFANLTAFSVYLLLPVAFQRPELGTTLADKIVGLEYALDFSPGANNLPSMHVAMAWIMACAMRGQRGGRLVGALIVMVAAAISIAVLFVKQHIVLDVATGVPWGLAAWWLASKAYRRLVDGDAGAREGLAQMFEPRRWGALLRSSAQRYGSPKSRLGRN